MPGNDKLITDMLSYTSMRDTIAAGLWRRYMLEPASRYEWLDPREADGVPILARHSLTPGSINERLHVPYDREIVSNKVSYFASNIQLVFDPALPDAVPTFYKDMEERGGFKSNLLSQAKYCVDQGTSYLMAWVNEAGDFKVRPIPADQGAVYYNSMTGDPELGFRYFIGSDEESFCEVYDGIEVSVFRTVKGTWTLQSTRPHGLGTIDNPAIPIIELRNNPERIGNPEMVISLCDAFDTSMSDLSSEIAMLRLSYLLISGAGTDTAGIKEAVKTAGIIVIDDSNGSANFVDRNMNVTAVQQLQDQLRMLIFEGSASYNPSILSEGVAPTAYEVNMRFQAMEEDCTITVAEWQAGLRWYDIVVRNYLTMWEGVAEYDVTDIERIFRRTAPRNILQALVDARNAGLTLSNETLLELSGLPVDPVKEADRLSLAPVEGEEEAVAVMPDAEGVPVEPVAVEADAAVVGESSNVVSLNGAQVASATEIVKAIGTGEMTKAAAVNMLSIMFNLQTEQANAMVAGMEPGQANEVNSGGVAPVENNDEAEPDDGAESEVQDE